MLSLIDTKLFINALLFQAVWLVCVQGNNLYAVIATVLLLIINQVMFKTRLKFLALLLIFSFIGYVGDNVISSALRLHYTNNFILFPQSELSITLAPLWLLSLWIAFSTTLNHSLAWLQKSPYIAFLIGGLLVPLSYLAGINLSNSEFLATASNPNINVIGLFYIIEGLWWALLLTSYQQIFHFYKNLPISNEASHD